MDEFIHRPRPYLLLSPIGDEILTWMIEDWMRNHLLSDINCNIVNLWSSKIFTRNDNKMLVTLHRILQLVLSKTTVIGDTKYVI
jgi:hypothetical protein